MKIDKNFKEDLAELIKNIQNESNYVARIDAYRNLILQPKLLNDLNTSIKIIGAIWKYEKKLNQSSSQLEYAKKIILLNLSIYLKEIGQFGSALRILENPIFFKTDTTLDTKLNNNLTVSRLINLGVIHIEKQDITKALSIFYQAENFVTKNTLINQNYLSCLIKINLGNIYYNINKSQSLKYFNLAETIANELNLTNLKQVCLINIANIAFNEDLEFSINKVNELDNLLTSLPNSKLKTKSDLLKAEIYIKKKTNLEDAKKLLENAFKVYQLNPSISILLNYLRIYGFYFKAKGNLNKAHEFLLEYLESDKENGPNFGTLQVLKSLSEIYEQQGDYQRAFETMKKKDALHEELFGEEKLRLFRNIEQQQEEMLQRERAMELEQKVRQLEHAALLSQMNPHFIFNSLNTLQNLVIEGNEEAAVNFISEFSTLMREMLNNAKEELIPLKNEIEFLKRYVQLEEIRFNNKFNFSILVDAVFPKHLVKVPVMLIQPLLENAIRHGLAPSKHEKSLVLAVRNGGPFIIVEVTDNGIGWKENTNKQHKSHALENIKERLSLMHAPNQQNGRIEIKSELSKGTQITLWIPVQF